MFPSFQRDFIICQYWKQTGNSSRPLLLCLLLLQSSCLTDRWNYLNNGRSLLLQAYHFRLSLLDHLGKLWWCWWYRHYTWEMDLLLTFLWFSSLSCEPGGYSFGRGLSKCDQRLFLSRQKQNTGVYVCLKWLTGYLGLALVFVWNSVQREEFSLCFSRVFC